MGRTIGAAVGAVLVVLFLASVATARGRATASLTASGARVSAQNHTTNKTAMTSPDAPKTARAAH